MFPRNFINLLQKHSLVFDPEMYFTVNFHREDYINRYAKDAPNNYYVITPAITTVAPHRRLPSKIFSNARTIDHPRCDVNELCPPLCRL